MQIPVDHAAYLAKKPYNINVQEHVFSPEQLKLLREKGSWMEALEQGLIKPVTPAQEHFVQVCSMEAEPETWQETAWMRLKGRRDFERQQSERNEIPLVKGSDYGLVEWDIDRWW